LNMKCIRMGRTSTRCHQNTHK